MSQKRINQSIIIFSLAIVVLAAVSFILSNWKILIGGTGIFAMLMYYISLKLKKTDR